MGLEKGLEKIVRKAGIVASGILFLGLSISYYFSRYHGLERLSQIKEVYIQQKDSTFLKYNVKIEKDKLILYLKDEKNSTN